MDLFGVLENREAGVLGELVAQLANRAERVAQQSFFEDRIGPGLGDDLCAV
jgi:hypothetical protein